MEQHSDDTADPRGTVDLVGHHILGVEDIEGTGVPVSNVIRRAATSAGRWIERSTELVGGYRARFRSIYLQWAMAINGLHVAAEKYASTQWQQSHQFTISGMRTEADGHAHAVTLATWPGEQAARAHLMTTRKMTSWGFVELYAALEELVMRLYRIYLEDHPATVLKDPKYEPLRQLCRAARANPSQCDVWKRALAERLDHWQREKIYRGIEKNFRGYCFLTRLRTPARYTRTDLNSWSETLGIVAKSRNVLVHGVTTVPKELADLCKKPHSLSFGFEEGQPLVVTLLHLQAVECFSDQLFTGINLALCEHPAAGT